MTLEEARKKHILPEQVLEQAYEDLNMTEEFAALLTEAASNNLDIARRMGLLDDKNLEVLRQGELPKIATGAFAGDEVDFEYVIPIEQAPELAKHFANLKLRPAFYDNQMGAPITKESMDKADGFYKANLITQSSYMAVGAEFERGR